MDGHESRRAGRLQGLRVGVRDIDTVHDSVGHGARSFCHIVMTASECERTGIIRVSVDAVGMSMTHRSNSAASGLASVTVRAARLGRAVFTAIGLGGQMGCWELESQ